MHPIQKPVLVIIQGGGCRQIEAATGMLKALDEQGIIVDLYRGASAGAIVAALHASGLSGKRMESIIRLTPVNRLFSRSLWGMFKLLIPGIKCDYLYSTDGLYAFLEQHINAVMCLQKVLVSVTRYPDDISSEYIAEMKPATPESVRASSAIQEIFPPVALDDGIYGDGGLMNNVPTVHISSISQYEHIYILLCPEDSTEQSKPWTKIGRCLQDADTKFDSEADEVKDTWQNLDNVTVLQPPPFPSSLLDWSKDFGLIQHAYEYAKTQLTNYFGSM